MTKHLENLSKRSIYMEFKVNFSLKTTTLHSGVVMKRINLSAS